MNSVRQTQDTATSIERITPRRTTMVAQLMPELRATAELLDAERRGQAVAVRSSVQV